MANDQGIPQLVAEVPVTVTVVRDEQMIFFPNAELNVTITDKYQISAFVERVTATDLDRRGVRTQPGMFVICLQRVYLFFCVCYGLLDYSF